MALPSRHLHSTQNLDITIQPSDQYLIGQQASFYHPTASSQTFFQNAQNVELKDSQITSIANANVTVNNNDPVTTILWPHVVAGAIFNSAAQHASGKCHPGTRKKIIERIVGWIEDSDPTEDVLWVHGAAGAGKSAIAHTICEILQESHPDDDGGSFFFSNGPSDRGNAFKLFTTLAYQLAIRFPSVRTELNSMLSRDPSLPTKSMETQLLSLIVQPLQRCNPRLSHSPVLIIDGLDECFNGKGTTQADIVALISKSVVDCNVPLRFVVFSRSEYWIRDAFDTPPLPDITLSLSLRDDVDADKDIKGYLTEEFERIYAENKRFMASMVLPWPPTEIVDRFVEEASGQYIYAATILRFIGNISKFSNPQKQLDILITSGPHRASAFSEMDRLYATIVSAYPHWETMKRVLAALLLGANTTIITVILGVDSDELVLVLDALSSLVDIKKRRLFSEDQMLWESVFHAESLQDGVTTISFSHHSFHEFLQDETRSGRFYIDLKSDAVPLDIVNATFGMVQRNLNRNYDIEPHIFSNIGYPTYHSTLFRVTAKSIRSCTISFLNPPITHLTARLERFDPFKLTHMRSIFYFICEMDYIQSALFKHFLAENRRDEGQPEVSTESRTPCCDLFQAIGQAHRKAVSALVSCADFEATPALVYLTEYWAWIAPLPLPFHGLRAIASVTDVDVVLALKQYRYFFSMSYNTKDESLKPTSCLVFRGYPEAGWRTQGAWRDFRISFASYYLKSIFIHSGARLGRDELYTQETVLKAFFDSKEISDIANKEYFQNPYNRGILSTMIDIDAWTTLLEPENGPDCLEPDILFTILRWINRQLTNLQTVTLLKNHHKTLPQTMEVVMKYIFDRGFVKEFTESSRGDLVLSLRDPLLVPLKDGDDYSRSWRTIKVYPLPHGLYEGDVRDTFCGRYYFFDSYWPVVHEELFGKLAGKTSVSIGPIIHPSKWYPHFLATLLRALVTFLFGKIYPELTTKAYRDEESFPYIAQCLPYGHPTPENLDALRAIVYLYPQVTPSWNPPEGLWPALVTFLHKYDRSILSAQELDLFVLWLNSTDHADINTYVGQ